MFSGACIGSHFLALAADRVHVNCVAPGGINPPINLTVEPMFLAGDPVFVIGQATCADGGANP